MEEKIAERDDIDLYVTDREVTLASGETVKISKLSWGREMKLYKILSKAFSPLAEQTVSEPPPPKKIYETLLRFPDVLTELAATFFGKDSKWVENHCTDKDIMEYVLPLSLNIHNRVLRGLTGTLTAQGPEETQRSQT